MGPFFVKITKIFWARNASPENFQKIPKHGSIFWAKSLNMGTFFTSKHGLGSRGPGDTPPSKPKSSTPPGWDTNFSKNLFPRPQFQAKKSVPETLLLKTWAAHIYPIFLVSPGLLETFTWHFTPCVIDWTNMLHRGGVNFIWSCSIHLKITLPLLNPCSIYYTEGALVS